MLSLHNMVVVLKDPAFHNVCLLQEERKSPLSVSSRVSSKILQ